MSVVYVKRGQRSKIWGKASKVRMPESLWTFSLQNYFTICSKAFAAKVVAKVDPWVHHIVLILYFKELGEKVKSYCLHSLRSHQKLAVTRISEANQSEQIYSSGHMLKQPWGRRWTEGLHKGPV